MKYSKVCRYKSNFSWKLSFNHFYLEFLSINFFKKEKPRSLYFQKILIYTDQLLNHSMYIWNLLNFQHPPPLCPPFNNLILQQSLPSNTKTTHYQLLLFQLPAWNILPNRYIRFTPFNPAFLSALLQMPAAFILHDIPNQPHNYILSEIGRYNSLSRVNWLPADQTLR